MQSKEHEFIIASDINERDGIGIELWKGDELILEIFRDDEKKTKTVTLFKKSVSLDLMEKSLEFFSKNILE